MKLNSKILKLFLLCALGAPAFAQHAQPSDMPQRIKQGTGANAYYLERTTENSSWQNCNPNDTAGQDSTCVVPYRYAAPAGLATITADFTKPTPFIGGTGTALRWTTTNAVSVTVTCTGVATYGPATVPVQGNPSGITLNSAVPGAVTCNYVALNSDNEPATATATATFTPPVPPTITASFSNPNPWVSVDTTTPIWSSANAKSVYVSCAGTNWGPGYVSLASPGGQTVFRGTLSGGAGAIDCTFTATNEIGQTASAVAHTLFADLPPPVANIWFTPASIKEGESSSVSWTTSNAVYVGIVCSGVEINYAGAQTPNIAWYWNPITFPTQGVQECGIQSINAAGLQTFTNATLYVYPTSGPLGGSPPPTVTTQLVPHCQAVPDDCKGYEGDGTGDSSGTE